jgi:hypothetical protein
MKQLKPFPTVAITGAPHVIHPNAVYSREDLQRILKLRPSTIRREVRKGRLKVAKRSGRYYFLGAWVLEWLETGQIQPRQEVSAELCRD